MPIEHSGNWEDSVQVESVIFFNVIKNAIFQKKITINVGAPGLCPRPRTRLF